MDTLKNACPSCGSSRSLDLSRLYHNRFTEPQSLWLLKAYLRMPWAWRIFGKQLFFVAKKQVPS